MARPSLNGVMCVIFLIVATLVVVMTASADRKPNYEAQANCIAEYDYHHPERSQYTNLVLALSECR